MKCLKFKVIVKAKFSIVFFLHKKVHQVVFLGHKLSKIKIRVICNSSKMFLQLVASVKFMPWCMIMLLC